jgi:hypothetical protein
MKVKKSGMAKILLASLLAMGAVLGILTLALSRDCKMRQLL